VGKEASEYLEEEKSNEIPLVEAIEEGKAQTESGAVMYWRCSVLSSTW
jgi:hypothetical protein